MVKKRNKIRVVLTEDGSIGKLELPVKLHTGTINMTDIEVYVPVSVNRTSTSFVKIYGNTINEKGEKVWSSNTYSVNFKTINVVNKFEYAVYEDKLPDEFSAVSGDLNITLAYADLDEDGTAIDILPSQTIHLYVNGAGFNQNGVQISNYDATVARLNLLSELSILKVDTSKELPLGIVFNKDGYKSPFYNFYTIEYTLPINATETAIKECKVIANSIVKDSESPDVIGYQTEFAYFDGGICQRTNKYNISQGSVNNYVLLESGVWEIVNQDYITPIKTQVDQNSEDIEVLYRLANTGSTPLGEYPSQDTVPTDSELNQYVEENFGRAPQNGDEFTFVLIVEDSTDIVYILLFSEVTGKWGKTPLPSVEPAKNGSMGIIKGTANEDVTATRKVLVNIKNGEINDILHNNENDEKESISEHLNRNSQSILENASDISEEVTRAQQAESLLSDNLEEEITRAKAAEELNATAIEEESTRAQQAEFNINEDLTEEIARAKAAEEANTSAIETEVTRATTKEGELDNDKLDKTNINDDYLKDIVFSINGDNGVATLQLHNPVTGQTQSIEITVTTPASSTNTGLMTSEMVQALNQAIDDIETLKYIGKQIASFQTYAEAELFDFSTISSINENDYFIVQEDESRTEPTEKDKTTRYVCINDTPPITINNFQFSGVVDTVLIQVATESSLGGVLSTNTNGYIYVENTGAMKLVGYDNLITSINNLTTAISNETTRAEEAEEILTQAIAAETARAQQAEQTNASAIAAEKTRAQQAEQENAAEIAKKANSSITVAGKPLTSNVTLGTLNIKRNGTSLGTYNGASAAEVNITVPTKTSDLTNDGDGTGTYAKVSQIPTNNNQLTNGANYATKSEVASTYATKTELSSKANQSDLTSEINNRTSADSNLQSQINNKASLDDLNTFTQQVRSQNGFLALSSDFAINKNNQTQGRFFIDDSDDLGIIVDSMAVSNSKNGIFIKKNSRVTNGVSITLKSLGTLKFTNDNSALKLSLDNIQADVATEINNLKGRSYIQEQTDTYVKWSDGRMEQHFTVTTSAGNVTSHTFPVAFTSTPIVHRNIMKDGTGNAQQLRGWNVSALTSTGFQLYTPDISGANTSMISAYGKWK